MLNAAIVGLGSWGRTLVESVQGKVQGLRFTAAYTPNPVAVSAFCDSMGLRLARDIDTLLGDPGIDAIAFATPNSQHCAQVRRAAQAGKHVFVEKPFALSEAEAQAALNAVASAGVCLAVGFNRRFHPLMRMLKAWAASGRLGVLVSIVAELTATTAFYRPSGSWRTRTDEEPAGALAGVGMHLIDAMIDVAGRVREVYCVADHRAGPHGEDTTHLILCFDSGLSATAACSLAAARAARFAVYGSAGMCELLRPGMDVLRFVPAVAGRASHLAAIPEPEVTELSGFNTVQAQFEAFTNAVRERRAYPIGHDEVLHGVQVFEAAVRSARTHGPVAVAGESRPASAC
ncbi:MAG: Gfo/Idh/MocA family oxidoreductase [Burkholderiales bacterium]|nr:Gfo/Idh/MocA family oxidoreductase [Burkholderiales bacterium]